MKQTDKTKSSIVASTLLIGAIFIGSVIVQHVEEPILTEDNLLKELPTLEVQIDETKENVITPNVEFEIVYDSDEDTIKPEIRFADAFLEARNAFGPGGTFEWNGNMYSTNRADDGIQLQPESTIYALDTTEEESTSAVDIEIAP